MKRLKDILLVLMVAEVSMKYLSLKRMKMRKKRGKPDWKEISKISKNTFFQKAELCARDTKYCQNEIGVDSNLFKVLRDDLAKKMKRGKSSIISMNAIVCMLMKVLAQGLTLSQVSRETGISKSTVSVLLGTTLRILAPKYAKESIMLPPTHLHWQEVINGFYSKNLLPCMGAIDGKHIRIKKPANSGTIYYNYKKFFSIVLLAICDSDRNFIYVNIGHPGSNNDVTILSNRNSTNSEEQKSHAKTLPVSQFHYCY